MSTETFSGIAARVTAVEKLSPAEKLGLIPGDIILRFGQREPLEAIELPSILEEIGAEKSWLIIKRDVVIFRMATQGGAVGVTLEPLTLSAEETISSAEPWITYYSAIRPGEAMLLLPESISPIWWPVPLLAYGYFKLWQMLAATLFLYGIGFATSPMALAIIYVASIVVLASGGSKFLRDTAMKDGFMPRAKLALATTSDVAPLEMITAAVLRLERDKAPKRPTVSF